MTVTHQPKAGAVLTGAEWESATTHVVHTATISATDPGAIGAGNLWLRLDPDETWAPMLYVRNAANDGWADMANAGYLLGFTWYDNANIVRAALAGSENGIDLEILDAASARVGEINLTSAQLGLFHKGGFQVIADVPTVGLGQVSSDGVSIDLIHKDNADVIDGRIQVQPAGLFVQVGGVTLGDLGITTQGNSGNAGAILHANGNGTDSWVDQAAAVADIADPTVATAEDVANKINALLASLRTAGLLAA